MRQLATLQKIENLRKHPNADTLDIVNIKGWEVITKTGDFKEGDWCVFFEIDSIVPDYTSVFDFMSKRKYRVKTQKLRGVVSQGLAMPVSIIDKMIEEGHIKKFNIKWAIGTDLTKILDVKKHDPEAEKERKQAGRQYRKKNPFVEYMKQYQWFRKMHYNIVGKNTKNFPWFVKKTDEERIQNMPYIFRQHNGEFCYFMEKLDGTSLTCAIHKSGKSFQILKKFFGADFYVCSRNLTLFTKNNTVYWKIVEQEGIEKKLRSVGKNIAIQGEIIGESVQKNKYKLKGIDLYLFNVIDLDKNYYYNQVEKMEFCNKYGFKLAPDLGNITLKDTMKVSDIVELSKGTSVINPKIKREGIVIRSLDNDRISFKAINPEFLLKYKL